MTHWIECCVANLHFRVQIPVIPVFVGYFTSKNPLYHMFQCVIRIEAKQSSQAHIKS